MNQGFIDWLNEVRREHDYDQITIDGETPRHSYADGHASVLHGITAWSQEQGIMLAQTKSQGKENENASVLGLLDMLNI